MSAAGFSFLMVGVTVLLTANIAAAEPVYLDCFTILETQSKQVFSVKLDEEAKMVTHTDPGGVFSADAFYDPGQITYQQYNPEGFGMMTLRKFIINRSSLKVTEFVIIKSTTTTKLTNFTSFGSCSVIAVNDG